MKHLSKGKMVTACVGLCTLFMAGAASAEYRVTAFGQSAGFKAILAGDIDSASAVLGRRDLSELDFVDANNLCVTQILSKHYEAAVATCSIALDEVESDLSIGVMTERTAKASIISNLAVALAQTGDFTAAGAALEKALSLNSQDRNALVNYDLVSARIPDTELVQGF